MHDDLYSRIIWSADVDGDERLLKMLNKMPKLKRLKIDRLYVEKHGTGIFDTLAALGIEVFYDAKYIEVPSKLEGLARVGCTYSPWMLNCMAGSISSGLIESSDRKKIDGLKLFADVCHTAGVRPCAVTVLTSKQWNVVMTEFNGRDSGDQVLFYVDKLQKYGFTDVVCSPEEVKLIRSESRFDSLDLNTPGVRLPGSSSHDQARTNTPGGAFQAGSDRIVSGRDLTESDDPAKTLDVMVEEATAALVS